MLLKVDLSNCSSPRSELPPRACRQHFISPSPLMRPSVRHNSQWCWWPSDKQTAVTLLRYSHCQNVDFMFLFPVLFWKYCLPPLYSKFYFPTLVNRLSVSPVRCFSMYWKTPPLCISWQIFFVSEPCSFVSCAWTVCCSCLDFYLLYFKYNVIYVSHICIYLFQYGLFNFSLVFLHFWNISIKHLSSSQCCIWSVSWSLFSP